jgi:hypothetical protein
MGLLPSQENQAFGRESSGAIATRATLSTVKGCCFLLRETEPLKLHLLLPVKQQETWVLCTKGRQFPWCFRVKVAGYVVSGEHGALSFCVRGEAGLTTKHTKKWSLEPCGNFRGRQS